MVELARGIAMPGKIDRQTERKLATAFERAAVQAGFRMKVRSDLGGEMKFETFAEDVVVGMAMNYAIDTAVRALKRQGIDFKLGNGRRTIWDDIKPDHYTIMFDGKTVRAGVQWNF